MMMAFRQQQTGAALVVGLILLIVLTLISLSALKNTSRQQLMTTNNEFDVSTFEVAESTIREAVNQVNGLTPLPQGQSSLLRTAITNATDNLPPPVVTSLGFDNFAASTTISYNGESKADGFSLGYGSGNFVAHNFNFDGQAILDPLAPDPLAVSLHRQGMRQIGPR